MEERSGGRPVADQAVTPLEDSQEASDGRFGLGSGTVSCSLHTAEGREWSIPLSGKPLFSLLPIGASTVRLSFVPSCHSASGELSLFSSIFSLFHPLSKRNITLYEVARVSHYCLFESLWGGWGYESRDESLIKIRGEQLQIGNADLAMIFRRPES